MSRSGEVLEVLRIRPFALLITGILAANLGAQLSFVAVATHLYALSSSTAVVGLTGLVTLVPMLLLGLLGGALADRIGRRLIVLTCQAAAAAAALVLAAHVWWTGGSVVGVLIFAGLWAASIALSSPARISLIPMVTPPPLLGAANAALTLVMTISWTVGPLLAAVTIHLWGYWAAYGSDALFGLVALLAFARLREPAATTDTGRRAKVGDGIRSAARSPALTLALLLDIIAMVLCSPRVLFPAAASGIYLGGGAGNVGLLFAALAVGATIGSLISTPKGTERSAPVSLGRATAGWGGTVLVFGLVLGALPAPVPHATLVLALLALAGAGLMDARATVVRQTMIQSRVDPSELGRIQGLVFVAGVASPRLGDSLMGVLGEGVGVAGAAVMGGIACIVATGGLVLASRRRAPDLWPTRQPVATRPRHPA